MRQELDHVSRCPLVPDTGTVLNRGTKASANRGGLGVGERGGQREDRTVGGEEQWRRIGEGDE